MIKHHYTIIKPGLVLAIVALVFITLYWSAFIAHFLPTGQAMLLGLATVIPLAGMGGKPNKSTDKQINIVWSTMDYDRFSFIDGNRPVNINKREGLLRAIMKESLERPIDVNEKYEIIDGQNRYEIWKELGLPIIYIVHQGWTNREIPILNSNQVNWKAPEYVRSFIAEGKTPYEIYENFRLKYGFGPKVNVLLLSGGTVDLKKAMEKFKNGEFKVTAQGLEFAEESASRILDFKDLYPGYKRPQFCSAMIHMFNYEHYDHKHMLHKVRTQGGRLIDCTKVELYMKLLKEIYNFRSRVGSPRID